MPPKSKRQNSKLPSDDEADAFFQNAAHQRSPTPEDGLKWSDVKENMLKHNYEARSMADLDDFSYAGVSRILQNVGFSSVSSQALIVFSELLDGYFGLLARLAKDHAQHARRTAVSYFDIILALRDADTNPIPSPFSLVEQELKHGRVKAVKPLKEAPIPKTFQELDRPLLPREEAKKTNSKKKGGLSVNTEVTRQTGPNTAPLTAGPVTAGGTKVRLAPKKQEVKEALVRPDYVPAHLPPFPHLYTYSTNAYNGPPPQPLAKLKAKIHHEAYLALEALRKMVSSSTGPNDSHSTLRLIFPEVLDVANYELAAEAADIAARMRMYAEVTGNNVSLRTIFDSVRTHAEESDSETDDNFGNFRQPDVSSQAVSHEVSRAESRGGTPSGGDDAEQEDVQMDDQHAMSRQESLVSIAVSAPDDQAISPNGQPISPNDLPTSPNGQVISPHGQVTPIDEAEKQGAEIADLPIHEAVQTSHVVEDIEMEIFDTNDAQ